MSSWVNESGQPVSDVAAGVRPVAISRLAGWARRHPLVLLAVLLACVLGLSIFIGRYPQPYWMAPSLLQEDELARQLVFNLRLPRILTAILLGMSLAGAGAVMQMIFRNPLVEPGFLGVSSGAGFGAALAIILLSNAPIVVETSAAFFAFMGLGLSYLLSRNFRYGGGVLRLILSGIAVSALFAAGLGLLKYVADPLNQLPEITFWLLGALWGITWFDVLYIAPIVIPALVIMWLMRWRLNLLSLSEETAFSLGVSAVRERALLLIAAVAATAAVVAVAGIVGWIGLIIPLIARRALGSDARNSLPAAMWIGGIFALVCDDAARALFTTEIPLGIITSLVGAFAFAVIMTRSMGSVRQ